MFTFYSSFLLFLLPPFLSSSFSFLYNPQLFSLIPYSSLLPSLSLSPSPLYSTLFPYSLLFSSTFSLSYFSTSSPISIFLLSSPFLLFLLLPLLCHPTEQNVSQSLASYLLLGVGGPDVVSNTLKTEARMLKVFQDDLATLLHERNLTLSQLITLISPT